jgi:hypothetical protein
MADASALREALVLALEAHSARAKEPHQGVYHFAKQNDAIGALIAVIDPFLAERGLWPDGKRFISNDDRLRALANG